MQTTWLLLSAIGVFPGYLSWSRSRRAARLAAATPTSTGSIASQTGVISCAGRVVSDAPLIAPISKKECLYYDLHIEAQFAGKDANGRDTPRWSTVCRKRRGGRFGVDDGSGIAHVAADEIEGGALVRTYEGTAPARSLEQWLSDKADDATSDAISGLLGLDPQEEELGTRRATEHIVPVGGSVVVFGEARGARLVSGERPVFASRLPRALTISLARLEGWAFAALTGVLVLVGVAMTLFHDAIQRLVSHR
jgi:hypothetical protein